MLDVIDGRERPVPVHIGRPKPVAGRDPAAVVKEIIADVRARGDEAVCELTERFDRARVSELRVHEDQITRARELVRPELISALEVASERLRATCERQLSGGWLERRPGELVGEIVRPLESAGMYVPGGRASYPSSVVMSAIPARVAGVERVAVCSPPNPDGEVAEAVLAACSVAGVTEVYRMGGAHAIAALAYGTETVRPVDKVVGPGNIFVTLAKREVQGWVGTDGDAGPTEITIVADDTAPAEVIAADLVAQAEHGPLGSHVLITWVPELVDAVNSALGVEVASHERVEDVENALIEGGKAVLVRDLDHALVTANAFASEHLALMCAGAEDLLDRVRNAGSVFVGVDSPVPVGDYVAGTNHVLPSGGAARWSSGLGVADFVKRIYVSGQTRDALERLGPHVEALAEAEGLLGHARALRVRLNRAGKRGSR